MRTKSKKQADWEFCEQMVSCSAAGLRSLEYGVAQAQLKLKIWEAKAAVAAKNLLTSTK